MKNPTTHSLRSYGRKLMSEVTGVMMFILVLAAGGVVIVAVVFLEAVWEIIKEAFDAK